MMMMATSTAMETDDFPAFRVCCMGMLTVLPVRYGPLGREESIASYCLCRFDFVALCCVSVSLFVCSFWFSFQLLNRQRSIGVRDLSLFYCLPLHVGGVLYQ